MDEILGIAIISLMTVGLASVIMCFLGFRIFGKYLTQQKRCTSRAVGEVVRYTNVRYSGVFRYPVVEFTAEDGKKYRIQGPEYRVHSRVAFVAPGINLSGFDIEENDQKQSVVVKCGKYSSEYQFSIGDNPLEHRYPRGTKIEVFYDPKAPKKGYVKRYCDKRFMFWIFQGTAIFCALTCIFIILIPVLFG